MDEQRYYALCPAKVNGESRFGTWRSWCCQFRLFIKARRLYQGTSSDVLKNVDKPCQAASAAPAQFPTWF
jgi:hypothetical protein